MGSREAWAETKVGKKVNQRAREAKQRKFLNSRAKTASVHGDSSIALVKLSVCRIISGVSARHVATGVSERGPSVHKKRNFRALSLRLLSLATMGDHHR